MPPRSSRSGDPDEMDPRDAAAVRTPAISPTAEQRVRLRPNSGTTWPGALRVGGARHHFAIVRRGFSSIPYRRALTALILTGLRTRTHLVLRVRQDRPSASRGEEWRWRLHVDDKRRTSHPPRSGGCHMSGLSGSREPYDHRTPTGRFRNNAIKANECSTKRPKTTRSRRRVRSGHFTGRNPGTSRRTRGQCTSDRAKEGVKIMDENHTSPRSRMLTTSFMLR